jgi:hypothetical protein
MLYQAPPSNQRLLRDKGKLVCDKGKLLSDDICKITSSITSPLKIYVAQRIIVFKVLSNVGRTYIIRSCI